MSLDNARLWPKINCQQITALDKYFITLCLHLNKRMLIEDRNSSGLF